MKTDEYRRKISEANSGENCSAETRQKMSEHHKGKHPTAETRQKIGEAGKGRPCSIETRQKISEANKDKPCDAETCKKLSESQSGENNSFYGKHHSEEDRRKMSASLQGISYEKWESFARDSPYCPLFNKTCRESNREKYDRRCFLCGLPESENKIKPGKIHKLSVHHIDMDKNQGCDGHKWKLIPVCIHCHNKVHNKLWEARIMWLLKNVWLNDEICDHIMDTIKLEA